MRSENIKKGVNHAEVPYHLQVCECTPPPLDVYIKNSGDQRSHVHLYDDIFQRS